MVRDQILKKAIKKAQDNGWVCPPLEGEILTFSISGVRYGKNNSITLWTNGLIFSHDFAKAFFGDFGAVGRSSKRFWEHHLQQMVLEEDPLKYLEKFI